LGPRPAPKRGANATGQRLPCTYAAVLIAVLSFACAGGAPDATAPTPSPGTVAPPSPSLSFPTPAACDEDLTEERADTVIFGAQAGDFLADRFSLATGDFNADGFNDLLIGAPLADGPDDQRSGGGEAYVIFGASSLPSVIDLATAAADVTLLGGAADDNFGFTVASGDVNGDGVDDILVGARFAADLGRKSVGAAYAVYGGPDLGGGVDIAQGEQDLTIVGEGGGDRWSVALAAGDVNGDGTDDVILGASSADGPEDVRRDAGAAAVVLGSRALPVRIDLRLSPPHFTVHGARSGDSLPNTVAAGDFDGDGRDEILLGVPSADLGDPTREQPGAAYIVDVPDNGGSLDLASAERFTTIVGADQRDGLGFFVAAGDVNADGIDDAVIGARDAGGAGNQRNNAGEVHVLFGSPDLPQSIDLANMSVDAVVYGPDANDSLGFTVATADLTGDGIDDILAGAPIADSCRDGRPDGGEVYAVSGGPGLKGDSDLAQGTFERALFGAEAGDELGFSLTAGDINGDGRDDIIAGALLADGPNNAREDAGQAHIVLSR
jgi:hypothetical protein